MKVSYEWLKELININKDPKSLSDDLTMAGLAVEKIISTGIGKQNVVVVELLDVQKHPNADKLFITQVDAGSFGRKQIVTNVVGLTKGQKVLAALEGVKLANGMDIKKTALKGIDSFGMFVGWEELGILQKSESLFFIDSNINNGTSFEDVAQFNDHIIDIELNANRGDCLGMIGVARDVKAIYGGNIKQLEIEYNTTNQKANDIFKVEIQSKNCLRYCGGVILDVTIKPSPYWMQVRLIKAGIRPINNVVDITNYILLECNQPLHAFDMDKITDKKIIIRDAKDGENITTLDDVERKLINTDMLIADPNTGHCLAGVMGGKISEVSNFTKNIFLEAAFFKQDVIRKTSKRTGLRSESSYRFERGIDKEHVDWALKRALHLFDKLNVGKVCQGIIDIYPGNKEPKIVTTTAEWINNKLGTDIKEDVIIDILHKLHFFTEIKNRNLHIIVPGWRNDVAIKEDIAEEVARIYGYNNIKHTLYPSYEAGVRTSSQSFEKSLRELLYKCGCDETVNYSFVGKSLFDKMLLPINHHFRDVVTLAEPLTDDWASMRNSMIPGMIRTAQFNYNRQNKSLSLFEIGNVSYINDKEMPKEEKNVCIMLAGIKSNKDHTNLELKYDFFDIKGILDCIFNYYKVEVKLVPSNEVYLHPFQQAKIIINNTEAGMVGRLHPLVADSFDLDNNLFISEISSKCILDNANTTIIYEEIPRFPSSVRDLAIVVDKNITAENILTAVESAKISILKNVSVFDIYSGKGIDEDKYSIALNFTFNKATSTLTDNEIDEAVNKILKNLNDKCGAKIR